MTCASASLDSYLCGLLCVCVCVCVWFAAGCTSGVVLQSSLYPLLILGRQFWASATLLSRSLFSLLLSPLLCFGYQLFVGVCVVLQKLAPVLPQQFSGQQLLLCKKKKKKKGPIKKRKKWRSDREWASVEEREREWVEGTVLTWEKLTCLLIC